MRSLSWPEPMSRAPEPPPSQRPPTCRRRFTRGVKAMAGAPRCHAPAPCCAPPPQRPAVHRITAPRSRSCDLQATPRAAARGAAAAQRRIALASLRWRRAGARARERAAERASSHGYPFAARRKPHAARRRPRLLAPLARRAGARVSLFGRRRSSATAGAPRRRRWRTRCSACSTRRRASLTTPSSSPAPTSRPSTLSAARTGTWSYETRRRSPTSCAVCSRRSARAAPRATDGAPRRKNTSAALTGSRCGRCRPPTASARRRRSRA